MPSVRDTQFSLANKSVRGLYPVVGYTLSACYSSFTTYYMKTLSKWICINRISAAWLVAMVITIVSQKPICNCINKVFLNGGVINRLNCMGIAVRLSIFMKFTFLCNIIHDDHESYLRYHHLWSALCVASDESVCRAYYYDYRIVKDSGKAMQLWQIIKTNTIMLEYIQPQRLVLHNVRRLTYRMLI